MKITCKILAGIRFYNFFGNRMRRAINHLSGKVLFNPINVWGKGRELPSPPEKTFKQWCKENQIKNNTH